MRTPCTVDDCTRPTWKDGLCRCHHHRWERYGRFVLPTTEERFLAKVDVNGPIPLERPDLGPCHLWTASLTRDGYGSFQQGLAHRWAYQHLFGPVSPGLDLDHLCRTRDCVNPHHLESVTHRENVVRGEGWASKARRTRCIHGHEFTEANTRIRSNGTRDCKTCAVDRQRRYLDRKKAA